MPGYLLQLDPNEGHGIANPEHQRDIVMRALGVVR
jgi:hypothetical protein